MRTPEEMWAYSKQQDYLREADKDRLVREVTGSPAERLLKYGADLLRGQGKKTPRISKN